MTTIESQTAYISIESDNAKLFDRISERFPNIDISRSRNLLGFGETISIIITGFSAIVAVLQYIKNDISEKKVSIREIKIQQGANSKIIVIQVLGRSIEEIAHEISKLADDPK